MRISFQNETKISDNRTFLIICTNEIEDIKVYKLLLLSIPRDN